MRAATRYPSRTPTEPPLVERREPVVWGSVGDGPLDAATLDRYDQRGFFSVDQLFGLDELASVEAELCALVTDPSLIGDERVIIEPTSDEVRSVFQVHDLSPAVRRLVADERLLGPVRQLLGSDVYIHQSRVNLKPGLRGKEFYWHSDFETWHHEDGMPAMRALSVSIAFTENTAANGSLMIMPGSHRTFVGCAGPTPDDHYRESLRAQHYGTPSDDALLWLGVAHGIEVVTGPPGAAVFFDCNCMHGSASNIAPFPRRNLFLVFNSVANALQDPFGADRPRPEFIAARRVRPLG